MGNAARELVDLGIGEAHALALEVLEANGFSQLHASSIATSVCRAQVDDCHSHGLYRLLACVRTLRAGKVSADAKPVISHPSDSVVRVDAAAGFSLLSFRQGLPILVEKARRQGVAAMVINHCFHFSALWPEVEDVTAQGLAALSMLPSHSCVAPAGGTRPVFGTNPIAFGWPRLNAEPYVFDFATSMVARGEIELHRRNGKRLPDGWAIDSDGSPTDDPEAALAGALLPFGGHKGSALSTMIELLAGPLIGDLLSLEALEHGGTLDATPYHGELVLAFNPAILSCGNAAHDAQRAELLFDAIKAQGARLPSERRYEARARNTARASVTLPRRLHEDILAMCG